MEKTFLLQKNNSRAYCKKAQGITLIALVVTIVVLLILAGITISTLFSDNGIVKKAQEAANKTQEAINREQSELNQLYNDLFDSLNNIGGGSTTPEEPLPEGAVQLSIKEWKNGVATVVITTSEEGYTLQYQIGGIAEENWTDTTSGYEITGLTLGQTVYGRLFNGTEGSKTADITVEDLIKPIATIDLSGTSVDTTGSVTATVTFTDNESGLNITGSKWVYNTNAGAIGEDESSYTNSFTNNNNPQTITLSATTAGTYYLHVLTVDNAENKTETVSDPITVRQLVTKISLNQTSATITEGETLQLTATITPNNASNKTLKWESNNTGVATVSTNGLVTAKTEGTATITATAQDGSNKTATCSVTVNKKPTPIADILEAGDYVNYIDGTGVTRKCTVLYDSSSSYGVEIITMESVENVYLGYNDTTVSGSDNFTKTVNSFNNAISTLNNATSKYINTTYSDKVRCVGSDPSNPTYDEPGYFTSSYNWLLSYNGKFKDVDTHYEIDWNQMETLGTCVIDEKYWLASRNVFRDMSQKWSIRYVYESGSLNSNALFRVYSTDGKETFSSPAYGLRPVFHLRSNIKVTGGTGEEGDPYTLGT